MSSPHIQHQAEHDGILTFTLSGVYKSYANAIQRTLLSDIPTVVFHTTPYAENLCNIMINTSRINNEIIKHRLSCIPVCGIDPSDPRVSKWLLEIDETNGGDQAELVTTRHFKIKDTETNEYLPDSEVKRMFPPFIPTNKSAEYYLSLTRLRPKLTDNIPAERLKLTCGFTVKTAKDNAAYNVVGTMAMTSTVDPKKAQEELAKKKIEWKAENKNVEFETQDWNALERLRHTVQHSHDFKISGIGIYENTDLVSKACGILIHKLQDLRDAAEGDQLSIEPSDTTMQYCYDITLVNEDYTIGNILNDLFYHRYYLLEDPQLSYCGFKKFHPHDSGSVVRVALMHETQTKETIKQMLREILDEAMKVFQYIRARFADQ